MKRVTHTLGNSFFCALLSLLIFNGCAQQNERTELDNLQTYVHPALESTSRHTFTFVMPTAQPQLRIQLNPKKYQRVRKFLIAAFKDKGYRFLVSPQGCDFFISMEPILQGKVQLLDGQIQRYNDASLMIQVLDFVNIIIISSCLC